MIRPFAFGLLTLALAATVPGCNKSPGKTPPLTASKDFRVDRCDIQYRGQAFPVTGTVPDMVKLLGPYDRLDTLSGRHFWDSLGLQVEAYRPNGQIRGLDIYYAYEMGESESGLRLSGRPQDLAAADEIRSGYPHGFFQGEMVFEGALIGPEIDFSRVNDTRSEYLKTQSGPDAKFIPIQQSWSNTRYAFERTCADGRHFRFFFFLVTADKPFRMQSLGIVSDNVQDSVYMPASVYRPGSAGKQGSADKPISANGNDSANQPPPPKAR